MRDSRKDLDIVERLELNDRERIIIHVPSYEIKKSTIFFKNALVNFKYNFEILQLVSKGI